LVGDSELYAVQALARNDPSLARDVFLSGASQDRYTIFSPIYSLCIGIFGLRTAALSLLVLFKVCFYGAVWAFARRLSDAGTALLTTTLAIVIPGEYGAYHVFRIAEDMLTARTIAEALAMTALALHVYGRRAAALALAAIGLCLHALVALPMVLLLSALNAGVRASIMGALAIVALVLAVPPTAVLMFPSSQSLFAVMDAAWLEVVRERSQFVFLQLWRLSDWELNLLPLFSLAVTLLVLGDARNIRVLCAAALTVGVAGLAVAYIAGVIGPVPILLQGQAWRWLWVPELVALLLVVPTVFHLWRRGPCGPLCAVLLLVAWLFPAIAGVYWAGASLCLWAARRHVPERAGPVMYFGALAVAGLAVAWSLAHGWPDATSANAASGTENRALHFARGLMELQSLPVILAFLVWHTILRSRRVSVPSVIVLGLVTVTAFAGAGALNDPLIEGSAAQLREFAEWRDAIPAGANVFVVERYYSAGFTWFTLQRPSYLTVDQSSGVIFSSATAAEIRRRADVLRPIEEPDWRLLSRRATHGGKFDARAQPLTKERLVQICADPMLDFVVAKEDVGLGLRMHHDWPGAWNGWNLYDCRRVSPRENPG
jgi:hypothetical protein